ncbi:hypothetical protein FB565_003379 [Actinoplanes lutulentus]|nr:hypothetical protein [Actinoplanes lutulentus]
MLPIAVFGGFRITGWGSFGGMLAIFGLMVAVATVEEVLFRGILFHVVEQRTGTWIALAVSATLFGLLHLVNDPAAIGGALAIIAAGLMTAAAYVATRALWLPIGLHLGWNFAEGGIFGVEVSGSDNSAQGLLRGVFDGPALLTGGGFGPEASVFAVLACLVTTWYLLRLARSRGNIRPRRPICSARDEAAHSGRVTLLRALPCLRGLDLAVLRRRVGDQAREQLGGGGHDGCHRGVEDLLVGLRGLGGSGDLPDILQRRRLDLIGRRGRLEVV